MVVRESLIGIEDNAEGLARLRGALVVAIDEMESAQQDYTKQANAAASAEVAYRMSDGYARIAEDAVRAELIFAVVGKNEAERTASLHFRMNNHPTVGAVRIDRMKAQDARDEAKAKLDAADVRQKVARAKVAALTALVAGV